MKILAERSFIVAAVSLDVSVDPPLSKMKGLLDGFDEPLPPFGTDDGPVDQHLDGCPGALEQRSSDLTNFTIDKKASQAEAPEARLDLVEVDVARGESGGS